RNGQEVRLVADNIGGRQIRLAVQLDLHLRETADINRTTFTGRPIDLNAGNALQRIGDGRIRQPTDLFGGNGVLDPWGETLVRNRLYLRPENARSRNRAELLDLLASVVLSSVLLGARVVERDQIVERKVVRRRFVRFGDVGLVRSRCILVNACALSVGGARQPKRRHNAWPADGIRLV